MNPQSKTKPVKQSNSFTATKVSHCPIYPGLVDSSFQALLSHPAATTGTTHLRAAVGSISALVKTLWSIKRKSTIENNITLRTTENELHWPPLHSQSGLLWTSSKTFCVFWNSPMTYNQASQVDPKPPGWHFYSKVVQVEMTMHVLNGNRCLTVYLCWRSFASLHSPRHRFRDWTQPWGGPQHWLQRPRLKSRRVDFNVSSLSVDGFVHKW